MWPSTCRVTLDMLVGPISRAVNTTNICNDHFRMISNQKHYYFTGDN